MHQRQDEVSKLIDNQRVFIQQLDIIVISNIW